ncbi:Kinesin-like protein KIN-14E (Kinesin-like calmodulin-binding protein) (Protein ZWICHEL) [Durusdinium trenchii]|uniref:Kinesin-like protein KIN-14E (Kinesin-like calmodulin-binding protein) (Protein ZWICHEL) n=1 Tax=Durusdinium trenchii TaxID=1381693 RepID=A0ABP0JAM8_9DINO
MIELYKQEILDLLVEARRENSKEKQLQIKKDAGRGIMFVEAPYLSIGHEGLGLVRALLSECERRRHTAATAMNTSSSRSHLLLSIIVEATAKDNDQVIYGKITLCDLAGSERLKKSEVSGDALKEAIEINKSLTALGDVIEALSKGSKNVPYRNHKLTMLMQDSLGGSAKTLMFVNCSPASSNAEDSSHVIYVAFRAEVGELVDVVTESTTCVVHMLRPLRRNGSYKPPFEKGVF